MGTLVNGVWLAAVATNFGGTSNFVGDRAYNAGTDTLGTFGYNSADHTTWAVVNHNSDFASVPEPGTNALIAVAVAALAGLQLRNRRKANA